MTGFAPRRGHRHSFLMRVAHVLALGMCVLATRVAAQETFTVHGRVTSETTGEPIPGVSVQNEAARTGVVTAADGTYSINVRGNQATLKFSSIGYASREVPVTTSTGTVNITLGQSIINLDQLVVTGLASTIKRSNLANAVSTVTAKELTGTTRQETVDGALNGKLPGVNIRAQGGAPGGGVNMQFRGISTLGAGSSQPLFIIDGVYVDNSVIGSGRTAATVGSGTGTSTRNDNVSNRVADLNPEDIESVEVLKGPSAAAIYGARANAGVVIINTKRGAPGRTAFSLSQDIGFASALRFIHFDDWSEEKIDLIFPDPARNALEKQRFRQGVRLDYEDLLYGNKGLLSNTQLSVSGGSDNTRFYIGGGLQDEDGIVEKTGFARRSIRANIDHTIGSRVKLSSNSNYVNYSSDRGFSDNGSGQSIGYNLANTPNYYDLRPVNGVYPDNPYFRENPFSVRDFGINNEKVDRFIQGFTVDAFLMRNDKSYLKVIGQGGLDYLDNRSLLYFPEFIQNQRNQPRPGDVIRGKQSDLNTNWQAFLNFNTNVGATNFNSQLGLTGESRDVNNLYVRGQGLAPGQSNVLQAQVQQIFTQFEQHTTNRGIAGQQEINWADRVIGTAGLRLDKSTLNAAADKLYAFPKASVAVNLANFAFWSIPTINPLKLRAAYGETGGLPIFGQTFEVLQGANVGGALGSVVSTRAVDPNLKPERAAELEFGLDAGFWQGRAGIEATYYHKKVSDLILDLVPAGSTGILQIATNAADLTNNGVEIALRGNPIRTTGFNWNAQLMYWDNKTKITRLDVPAFSGGGFGSSLGDYLTKEGYSPTTIVGTPALPDGSLTIYGDGQPDFNLSLFNEFIVAKNVTISGLLHWQKGGKIINLTQFLMDGGGVTPDWSDDDDGDGIPNGRDRGPAVAGRYIDEGGYVKLREAGITWTVPQNITSKFLSARRMKLGLSGRNLWMSSKYRSYDPEVSVNGVQAVASTVEIAAYPSARRFMFNVSVDF